MALARGTRLGACEIVATIDRWRSAKGFSAVGYLLGFLTAALLAAVIWLAFRAGGSPTPRVDVSRPTVLSKIHRLQRLETVVFGMDKIVAGERENRYLPKFLAGDRLLLIVFGEVTAGIDVGRIQTEDVVAEGPAIRLKMPEPEVFASRLDNERTRVYSRGTGLFSRVDPDLESDVRREAERQIRQAALDNGILEVAKRNARATLTSFLRGLGFDQADVY